LVARDFILRNAGICFFLPIKMSGHTVEDVSFKLISTFASCISTELLELLEPQGLADLFGSRYW
jgi:hypothetical protein